MLFVSILMFILATTQLGINFARAIRGLILHRDVKPTYWNHLDDPTQVAGSVMYVLQTFVGDAVALYRTYVVWSRRLEFVALPGLIFLGSLGQNLLSCSSACFDETIAGSCRPVSGIGILVRMGTSAEIAPIFFNRVLGCWITAFFSCTLATSIICTLLISSRIWYLGRNSISQQLRGTFRPAARVIFESGALYSSVLIALLALFITDCWFQYVLVDSLTPLIGIVFSIIIVRIGLGVATDPENIQDDRVLRQLWAGSRTDRQAPRELSTLAASGEIESNKTGKLPDGGSPISKTLSNTTRLDDYEDVEKGTTSRE
ncbi:hypothetical protein NP233_g707 [Leucocoprinus birnbaumii]|uniref:Uncharacterized protein n=1 Tax=Leucocoprinus birnbaumii TaxID=56174 RepID=A0AAD5W1B8_9AGAR|nr:hypothetical protein NP233_g707 [Leucocoprinus birnbaumii]